MDLRRVAFAFVLLTGLLLTGYAVTSATPSRTYYVDVQAPEAGRDLPDGASVVDYQHLSPAAKRAFKASLETGGKVQIGTSHGGVNSGYVHYEGTYYLTLLATENANNTQEYVLATSGIMLSLLGMIGWWMTRSRIVRGR